jgi:hypothetical protein
LSPIQTDAALPTIGKLGRIRIRRESIFHVDGAGFGRKRRPARGAAIINKKTLQQPENAGN